MTTLARAVFVLLVGATFAAFFAAQRIKGEPAVAQVVSLARVFSPNGDGRKEVNRFEVELRERARSGSTWSTPPARRCAGSPRRRS